MNYIPAYADAPYGRRGLTYIPTIGGFTGHGGGNKLTYIPAQSGGIGTSFARSKYNEYSLGWWEDNSIFYYPAILVSAYYGLKHDNYREFFNIPKNCLFIGDSGGFQNMTQNANLDWKQVLNWQEKNCDIIFSLDYPPSIEDSIIVRNQKYNKSIENIKLLYENKKDKKYYACIHGFNEKELIDYYNKIKDFNLDGYSHGQFAIRGIKESSKLDRIVLAFALNENKKNIHLLGLGGSTSVAFAHLLSEITKINFTYDNSSYGGGAMRREYTLDKLQNIILNQTSNINNLMCDCPVCSISTSKDMKADGSISGALISLHNLYKDIQKDGWINSFINSYDDLYKYLMLDNKSNEIKKRFELLFKTQDIEKYIRTYKYELILDSTSSQARFI